MSGREFAPRLQIIGGSLVISLDVHRAILWLRYEYWSPEVGMLAWEKHWVLDSSEIVKRVRVAYHVEKWGGRNGKLSERFLGVALGPDFSTMDGRVMDLLWCLLLEILV